MVEHAAAAELFDRRRRAWLDEDVDGYLALFADDVVLATPTLMVEGIAAYSEVVRGSLARLRPVAFDFHRLAVNGDSVLAEWTITLELRADGRRIRYRGMSACELRGGRIVEWREYYDSRDLTPTPGH